LFSSSSSSFFFTFFGITHQARVSSFVWHFSGFVGLEAST
jgi:hypothetical protein